MKRILISGLIFSCLLLASPVLSQGFKDQFVDTLDNALDLSQWLSEVYGFVPLVMPITEPAVGYGAGVGLIFFHERKKNEGRPAPPSVSMVGGLYTESKSWGTVLLHQGIWKGDRIRYLGVLGYINLNMSMYREIPYLGEMEFGFNLKGAFLVQQLIFRLGDSDFFAGGRYSFFTSTSTFTTEGPLPVDSLELDMQTGALGPVLVYDGRDNTFTPNRGMYSQAGYAFYDEIFGSDEQFHRLDTYWTGFMQPASKLVLGLRADFRMTASDAPYFAKPFVQLRGIPAMRFQDDRVVVLETEERFDLTNRWSLVAYGGIGKSFTDLDNFSEKSMAWSAGGGFRYKIARLFGVYTGIDVARGNEDWAFYIQFGHYWNSL